MYLKKGNWKLWVQLITQTQIELQTWELPEIIHTWCTQDASCSTFIFFSPKLVAGQIPGARPSKHRLDAHWKHAFFQFSRKSLKLHLFNKLHRCLCCGDGTRPFESASRFAKRSGLHYWLVSSWMKTDVVLLACHKSPNQLTYEDTQTDLVSGWGWDVVACVDPARERRRLECNKLLYCFSMARSWRVND